MGPNRPRRIKHSVYQSLDENKIISTRHVLSPKKVRSRKHAPDTESYHHTYSLRGSRATEYVDEGANYSEEEEDSLIPLRQRSAKRRKIESGGDDDDFVEEKIKKGKSKRTQEEESEEENNKVDIKQTPRRSTRFAKNVEEDVNEKENVIDEDLTASRKRGRPRKLTIESKQDDEEDEEDAKEDEEMTEKSRESTAEPRQYQLRSIRAPVDRYSSTTGRPIRKAAPVMFSRQRFINNPGNRRSLREKRKRRSRSSSTSSSSDEELTNAKRDAKDEAKFQRRLMRSMNQSRQNLLPINMTEKDLSGSKHLVKERLRQIGQVGGNSCTDIDPMGIDKAVGFDSVGGCTSHLQSLKETVLFPLVYPELFEKFKITPPKGILFYGPPGTGKTLIARALANECSQGDKKVAFFMRKGADCLSKWIGESERQLRLLFDQAYSMRPSIIFFDEIDGLAPVRSSRQDQIHSSIVSTLLALMDGLDAKGEVVVIGATNRLDSIDPALRRPGRFDRELRFSLPDKTARRSILDIHTKLWNEENKPSEEEMNLLAEKTSGYCGADLRSLCTEAVLVAIRNKFPHIYLTSDKLAVNPSSIKINQEHFITAMRNIVPACRRDVSIVSKQLNPRLSCLMDTVMEEIFDKRIPLGYLKPQNIDNLYKSDLEKVVRALEIPPSVPASRFLLYGNGNQGQTHYYLPVISNRLDHLCMHSISSVTLFSSVNPEESLNQILHAAIRSTSNGTSTVLLLPDIDVLQASLPSGCWNMLISRLESFVGFTSLLMIATLRQSYDTCSEDIRQLFGYSNIFEIKPPSKHQREKYFREIVSKSLVEPVKFNADDYPPIPKAVATEPTRKLSAAELKVVEEKYENALRHFRIFLRDVLSKLIRDRRFNIFNVPVDIEDAEDYYEIIKNPLCLTEMMAKLNRNEYKNKQEFVDDICLIRHNAIEYNPETDMKSRLIRNNAFALLDITEALFEEELDDDFVEKLEEMKKMIDEAKNAKEKSASQVIQLQRRTRLSVLNGFKEDEPAEKEERNVENAKEEPTNGSENVSSPKVVQEEENEESKNADPNNDASNDVPSVKSDTLPEVNSNTETPMDFISQEQTEVSEKPIDPVFIIDKNEIEKVVITAIDRTNNWSIPQLESLGAALTQRIERYTSLYDRTTLPLELIQLVNEFVP